MLAKIVLLVSVITCCHGMQSLIDVIGANNGSTMVSLIKKAGLTSMFSGPGPFTVFVPVDAAFAAIPAVEYPALSGNIDKLAKLLKYHVIVGETFSSDFSMDEILQTIIGQDIRLYSRGSIYVNDAKLIGTDFEASNGVVHLIDRVLDVPEGTLMNVLDSPDHNLTEFAAMVRRSNTNLMLSYSDIFTIFAPSNNAMANLPDAVKTHLLSTSSQSEKELVMYHIHSGVLNSNHLNKVGRIATLLPGHNIRVDTNTGNVRFNGKASLEESDIKAKNGIVHVIDGVLIPEILAHPILG